jgi:hypothetical protein
LIALTVGGPLGLFSPRQAKADGEPLQVLSENEGQTIEALGEVLLPGAATAGIAHFIDSQLISITPLLMLRYLDFPMSFLDFYRQGLAAVDTLANSRHGRTFQHLEPSQQSELVLEFSKQNPADWQGPPAPLFYFVTRNDAMDVFYGTQQGFAKLKLPYMPHIAPHERW